MAEDLFKFDHEIAPPKTSRPKTARNRLRNSHRGSESLENDPRASEERGEQSNKDGEFEFENNSNGVRPKTSRNKRRTLRNSENPDNNCENSSETVTSFSNNTNHTNNSEKVGENDGYVSLMRPTTSENNTRNPQRTNESGTRSTTGKNSIRQNVDNQYDEEEELTELEIWVKKAMDGDSMTKCNPDLMPSVITNLRILRNNLQQEGYYDESVKANNALDNARNVHRKNLHMSATQSIREELEQRLEEAKLDYQDLQEVTKYQEDRMNEIMVRENAVLLERQRGEFDQLANEWENEKKYRMYNKVSPELRTIRDTADRLLKAKRYNEYKLMIKKADALEKEEAKKGHFVMESDFQTAVEQLKKKHMNERKKQERSQQNRRKEYFSARDFDLNIARRKIAKIEQEIKNTEDPEKVWALHHRHDFEMPPPLPTEQISISKRSPLINEFNTIKLPPLRTSQASRKALRESERNYKFNKSIVL